MTSRTIALIPARVGSKGVPNKNFREITPGRSCLALAVLAAAMADVKQIVISSDAFPPPDVSDLLGIDFARHFRTHTLFAPTPLHTDTCAMIEIVRDALVRESGQSDDIWVLLQPSSPLRRPEHIRDAINMLAGDPLLDSVVSVVSLGNFIPITVDPVDSRIVNAAWLSWPPRRQVTPQVFKRDGTVYAFRRDTVETYDNIYGEHSRALIIPPEESLSIDTEADWQEAERRLRVSAEVTQ